MLTSTTKNRINSCRDILVGKIPDPKGQIDQITNALVYKFMDDQDRMSRELGYETSFFKGDYEQYAWSRLFDTKLMNQDRANLYIEGLDRLSRADHLPDLFKQIFKDAYLPFRDANTIVMFLTEINGFDYHHSEELGNAFEYLLSIMGSQGDAGQFRTPRHIIEFLVDVVDPQKSETILDPACGTAGFLVEAFKHITAKGDLGVQDVAKLADSITGVDIDPGMAKIARVNLYLHGFKTPKITENDTLTNEKLWGQKYDVILANPPFMTPKGGIQPHDKFAIRANRAEVLFTDYIAEHLKLHGRAGIIVPEGIIFQGSNAYKDLRKMLVDGGYLWAVVSLPAGCFNPYSGVKTTILFLDRERAKNNDSILFVKISADGYDLGAQRRPIENNDLPKALEILNAYKNDGTKLPLEKGGWGDLAHLVEKSKIAESGEYNLSGDRYIVGASPVNTEYETVELGEVCEINPKKSELSGILEDLEISFVPMADLSESESLFIPKEVRKLSEVIKGYTYFRDNDVLLAKVTPCFENGKSGIAKNLKNGIGFGSSEFIVLRCSERIKPELLYRYISRRVFIEEGKNQMSGTGGLQRINPNFISTYKIPLPPLEIQEQIVAELDGYQRIIDGARAVVENYKPTIKIDPDWKMVKIGELVERGIIDKPLDGNHGEIHPKAEDYIEEGIPFIMANDLCDGKVNYLDSYKISDKQAKSLRKGFSKNGDVLLTHKGTIGVTAIVDTPYEYIVLTPQVTYYRIIDKDKLLNGYLKTYFESTGFQDVLKRIASIGATRAYIGITSQLDLTIALPPLETQQSIVEQIEEEQRLVDANRRLIEIYEGKIREKMDEVWGVK